MIDKAYLIFLETLCNKNRLEIIDLLNHSSLNVSQICNKLKMNQTTASHNLSRLEKCGFVTSKKIGKFTYYRLNENTIKPLMKLMESHLNNYCRKLCCSKEQELKIILRR